ncbi:GGDEF domain-containing protein [Erythrobacter sp. Alg231-14]|uniref:GGDEF domain-containing protein n=1 Tax=Erythrobacter sp. Alg231-14 TaxID=1922225 RepID=UPI00307B7A8A
MIVTRPGAIGLELGFSVEEGRVLHGLLEDASGDIVVRLDPAGFITHASENAAELGIDLSSLLLMPHIADLADADHSSDVARHVARALSGEGQAGWIEFPIRSCSDLLDDDHFSQSDSVPPSIDGQSCSKGHCHAPSCLRWYAFSLKVIEPEDGSVDSAAQGALGLIRSVQHKRSLEGEINAHALTDPMTGLANRHAFNASLSRSLTEGSEQTVAIMAVDSLRAVFMQYGQRTADEIQWGFAKFLETMAGADIDRHKVLAQLDGDRFAVLLPGMSLRQARSWAQDVLETFAGLTSAPTKRTPELTASAGLARVEVSVDWTMRQAELGLVMARAGGGMRVRVCNQPVRAVANGTAVTRAMDEAVERAVKRRS